jgi:hypothetical protein
VILGDFGASRVHFGSEIGTPKLQNIWDRIIRVLRILCVFYCIERLWGLYDPSLVFTIFLSGTTPYAPAYRLYVFTAWMCSLYFCQVRHLMLQSTDCTCAQYESVHYIFVRCGTLCSSLQILRAHSMNVFTWFLSGATPESGHINCTVAILVQ